MLSCFQPRPTYGMYIQFLPVFITTLLIESVGGRGKELVYHWAWWEVTRNAVQSDFKNDYLTLLEHMSLSLWLSLSIRAENSSSVREKVVCREKVFTIRTVFKCHHYFSDQKYVVLYLSDMISCPPPRPSSLISPSK
jgi:hypothetical protein